MVFTSIFSYNKNTMFRSFHARLLRISAMLVLLVLPLAVSCRLGEENTSVLPDSGKAYVSIAGTGLDDGRTAIPAVTESDVTSFTLSGKFSDSADAEKTLGTWTSSTAMKNASVPLNAGTWNFTLTAQISGATYRAELTEKAIAEDEVTPLSFELVLSEIAPDGKGAVSITVAFPTKNVAKISGALYAYDDTTYSTPISGSQKETESVSGGTYTYSLSEIGSGTYVAVFQLWGKDAKSGDWLKLGSPRREYCGIIDGKTSESTVTFTATDTVFSILYRLNGGTLSGNCRGSFTRREENDITLPAVTKEDQCLFKQDALFAGWYTTSDCSGEPVTSFTPAAQTTHLTLYAKWCPTVLYVTPGATATGGNYWDGFTEDSAFGTVGGAIAHINSLVSNEGIVATHNWTLKLNATGNNSLKEAVSIGDVPAASLLIMGMNYDEVTPASKDTIWGGGVRTPVTISGTTPVTIRGIGISNVNESGGVASGLSGILINGTGKVTVEKSGLNGHTASGIRIEGNADVEFRDSWLGQNSAENGAGIYKAGSGKLTITNSTIENNTASASGGGVYVDEGSLILNRDANILRNTAATGGGVYSKSTFSMTETSLIAYNEATTHGGGVYNEGGTFFMYGSAVIGDKSASDEATSSSCSNKCGENSHGGGIYSDGGAIYLGYADEDGTAAEFDGGIYFNYSAFQGGGIYSGGSGTLIKMRAGSIDCNGAYGDGGGIRLGGSSDRFEMAGGTLFKNKSNEADTGSGGGGVYLGSTSSIVISGGTVSQNSGLSGGGVLSNGSITMSGGTVSGNTAAGSGGGIYADTNSTLTLSGGTISGNTATNNGGGVFNNGTFTLTKGMIGGDADGSGNTAGNGGGVFNGSMGIFTMESGGVITGNSAKNGGGVLVFGGDSAHKFVMNGGEISNNKATTTASGGGGGVYTQGVFEMNGGIIGKTDARAGNSSSMYGGGVFVSSSGSFTMADEAVISGNTASYNGGGVMVAGGMSDKIGFEMTDGTISENTAQNGGGIYASTTSTLSLGGGTISGNKATQSGGGIYTGSNSTLTMEDGIIADNTATAYGGGVYTYGSFTMSGSTISGNTASGRGGGVYALGTSTMSDSTISGNTASLRGGGVFVGGTFKMSGTSVITGNKTTSTASEDGGGGVYVSGSATFEITGGTISANTTAGIGGGIFAHDSFTMGGSAYIPAGTDGKNDVYMYASFQIKLASPLTATTSVATITPSGYMLGKQILSPASDSTTTLVAEYEKFAVAPNGTENWGIDSEGCLQKVLFNGITISVPTYTSDDLQLSASLSADGTKYTFTAKTGYSSYVWSIDGNVQTTAVRTYSVETSSLSPGNHTLLLIAKDTSGNYHNATTTVTVQ